MIWWSVLRTAAVEEKLLRCFSVETCWYMASFDDLVVRLEDRRRGGEASEMFFCGNELLRCFFCGNVLVYGQF